MKNRRSKSWIILSIGIILLTISSYSIYKKIYGINSKFIIYNISRSVFYNQDKFKYVDFRIIVNDEEVFNESLRDGLHREKKLDINLNFGFNRIEVYSDSSKQYDVKSEYVFLNKQYDVGFTRSIEGINSDKEYFNLYIY